MLTIPALVPRAPREKTWNRHLAPSAAFAWLGAGWRDLMVQPFPSLGYGALVFLVSIVVVVGLFWFGWDYILFPALAGFMVVGPILAVGLYEKSRRIAAGEPVDLRHMIFVKPKSGGQILFTGVLLCLLMLVWMRAAVIIYALFFGLLPFRASVKSFDAVHHAYRMGHAAGRRRSRRLFAAFSFAISAFSIPMLLNERVDALTAMGTACGAGLEQPSSDADLGRDRGGSLSHQPGNRPCGPGRRVSHPGSRHLACIPHDEDISRDDSEPLPTSTRSMSCCAPVVDLADATIDRRRRAANDQLRLASHDIGEGLRGVPGGALLQPEKKAR